MLRFFVAAAVAAFALALPATAGPGPSVTGGGVSNDGTRFGLAISGGDGRFECLMPAQMTVEAIVTNVTVTGSSAAFSGTASVTLGGKNPFGLPSGVLIRGTPFTATATAGGPGVGTLDLNILGLDFPGTVAHGQISVTP
jgi:hypothetical protein